MDDIESLKIIKWLKTAGHQLILRKIFSFL